jgi:hypothetical protein
MAIRYLVLFVLITSVIACTDDENTLENVEDQIESNDETSKLLSTFQTCDSVAVATSIGTSCCVSGPTVAQPGDTLKFHYQINQNDQEIYWVILDGDINIIAGANTHTVTVKIGSSFTFGLIQGRAKGDAVNNVPATRCEESVKINLQ